VTAEEQKAWRVPPCISSWKNPKGYTVPLDKRLAADGKHLQEKALNSRIADFAEALYVAEQHKREEVQLRARVEARVAEQERRRADEKLREIAEEAWREARRTERELEEAAREEERQLRRRGVDPDSLRAGQTIRDRERIRRDLDYQREREFKQRALRGRRQVSEPIDLVSHSNAASKDESLFEQKVFDRAQGISSGFGDEDSHNLYEKPLFATSTAAHLIYRGVSRGDHRGLGAASGEAGAETELKEAEAVRFSSVTERLSGSTPTRKEEQAGEQDPFGLDSFLAEAKSKRSRH